MPDVSKHWRVENGELVNDGHGLYLTTVKNFKDFELLLEYKTVAKADSGIYLRGYPQVQIWDTTEAGGKWKYGAKKMAQEAYGITDLNLAGLLKLLQISLLGSWNHFRITMVGSKVSVWLNELHVVDQETLINYWKKVNRC